MTTRRPAGASETGSITMPLGFRASAVAAGIKPDRLDLALIAADAPCAAAGVFTSNRAVAAPVVVSREHLASGRRARAIVVNAGCANAATGATGLRDAREMASRTASALGCAPSEVLVASTGVIGTPLPMDKVRAGIEAAARALAHEGGADVARAILTTDTHPKEVLVEATIGGRRVRVAGIAKGAGMIAPNMATLLAFFTTDAAVAPAVLRAALVAAVGETLNRITVDGDTSTNDTALILASGASGAPAIDGPGRRLRRVRRRADRGRTPPGGDGGAGRRRRHARGRGAGGGCSHRARCRHGGADGGGVAVGEDRAARR